MLCGAMTFMIEFIFFLIFTARKRSLRRLCFYRCLSVHGGGMENPPGWRTPWMEIPPDGEPPLDGGTPPDGEPPRMENPPGWRTPLDGGPPRMETPPDGEPPGWRTPRWRNPPSYGEPPSRSMCGRYASYWNAFL